MLLETSNLPNFFHFPLYLDEWFFAAKPSFTQ
jgi:hypothetical protein